MSAAIDIATFREQRRRYLGGTDLPAIIGVSPWASPLSVYLDKIGEAAPRDETLAMRRGLHLERFIADEFERAMPGHVCFCPKPLMRVDWGFPAGAQVDRMVATEKHPRTPVALLEAKTAFRSFRQWDAEAGEVPDNYYVQVQWQLAVADLSLGYGAADVGDDSLRIVPIEADKRVQERLIEAGREFWTKHVEPRVPPTPDGSERDGKALTRMWPQTDPRPAARPDRRHGRGPAADPLPRTEGTGRRVRRRSRRRQAAALRADGRARGGAAARLPAQLEEAEPPHHRHQGAARCAPGDRRGVQPHQRDAPVPSQGDRQ